MSKFGRPDATGRSSGKVGGKERKLIGPPPGQPWSWQTAELLASDAWRWMSPWCRKLIDFLQIEHCHHAGRENGRLQATYDQLSKWGIPRKRIPAAIREAQERGLVQVTRKGGLYGVESRRTPSQYRLTWFGSLNPNEPATNEWKKVTGKIISPGSASGTAGGKPCRFVKNKSQVLSVPAG